jgi:WASH complex subunit 7
VLWYPEQFLLKHVPSLTKFIDEKTVDNVRLTKIALRSQSLPKESHALSLQACHWMIEIDRITRRNLTSFDVRHLQKTSDLLIEGIKLVKKISEVVKWITNLHADKGRPMAKSVLLALCRLVEILKCFQFIFHKKLLPLVYIISLISQHLSHKALTLLRHVRKSLTQEKSYKEQQLDVLSALNICEQNLKGPNTSQRILIAKLSLSASGLSYDHLTEIRSVINRLELICCVHSILNRLCDCSFLYWHQIYMLPVYFSKLIETKADLSRYYLILSALSDCALIAGDKISGSTDNCLKKDLFGPLNQIVETNLRLQTHLHLQLPPSDPFKNTLPLNFSKFCPTRMDKYYISIKKETEHYLSTMFYNLTTVVLHDWRTYGEMRRLARLQYGLETVEDNLPMQTLEQGLDVLEIMRNINVFVGKYLYNLNNQVFVEESSNNKHLNTINISHVANSIRTHGIGGDTDLDVCKHF